ncbi:MAG: DUF3300 domain-containing protein [Gammaproteobacteria bacterium]|nr:DUF3300 domain-containing protein [Gammaproteobacteria bacterium]
MKKLAIYLLTAFLSIVATYGQARNNSNDYFSDAELEQILAPIALYPDSVLTHILIASTYPLEVVQANRWVERNPNVKPADALNAVDEENWDPSVKALIPFPNVLQRMSDDLEWTQKVGDAFLQDEERLLAGIQSLRRKADQAGSLDQMENMNIERDNDNIVIVPAQREVVYVPYYDTRLVYGNWYWHDYPPVYWNIGYYGRYSGLYYWYPRVHITYYPYFHYSAFHWHNRHIVVLDSSRRYSSTTYVTRTNVIRHKEAKRWKHNPDHRRGVAYRTEVVKTKYASSRPAIDQRDRYSNQKDKNYRVKETNRNANGKTQVNSGRTDSERQFGRDKFENSKTDKMRVNNQPDTRQQMLRQKLENQRDDRGNSQGNSYKGTTERNNDRYIDKGKTRSKETGGKSDNRSNSQGKNQNNNQGTKPVKSVKAPEPVYQPVNRSEYKQPKVSTPNNQSSYEKPAARSDNSRKVERSNNKPQRSNSSGNGRKSDN